jgi:3-phenylpropionate/trans-cinnamate dioxygenase ferredoxin subunit
MPEFVKAASVRDLPPGSHIVIEVEGFYIAVFNVNGDYYAIEDTCTHDGGPLAEGDLDGYVIECPRHGARFDIRTGKVLSFPAVTDVEAFDVKVEGGDVLVDIG